MRADYWTMEKVLEVDGGARSPSLTGQSENQQHRPASLRLYAPDKLLLLGRLNARCHDLNRRWIFGMLACLNLDCQ